MANRDNEFDTTVLTDDYDDFQDTVVDQVIAFDPALFQGSQGEMAQQAQRPTWVSAASSASSATGALDQQARPAWTPAQAGATIPPSNHGSEEDTWVLGSQPVAGSAGSAAGRAPAEPVAASTRAFPRASAGSAAAGRPSSAWQTAPRATPTMMAAADGGPARTSSVLIGVIVGLAIVGIIAIVVAVALLVAPQDNGKAVSSAPAVVPAQSSSSSASKEAVEPEPAPEPEPEKSSAGSYKQGTGSSQVVTEGGGRALSEAEAYKTLVEFYTLAGDYDATVRVCANEFNENYLKEDKATRNAKASSAASLKTKVKNSWNDLKDVELPLMSRNTQAYLDLLELYECLWRRIDVIDQAWKVDLTFDKPEEHQEEIVAPLRAQQVGGNDKYYTRFKDLYPTVNLVKP